MLNPPENCVCGAERKGIQEGRVYYKCGSRGTEWRTKLKLVRTQECIEQASERGLIQSPDD